VMTVVTHVKLKPGQEPEWDAAFRERVAAVKNQPGWVAAQLCVPAAVVNERVVIGTWETRADWEAWHATAPFESTRSVMEAAETGEHEEWWHEVVLDLHKDAGG
jgi:heme-degrading monooxygenase HmoA